MNAPEMRAKALKWAKTAQGDSKTNGFQEPTREIPPFENYRAATSFRSELFRPSLGEHKQVIEANGMLNILSVRTGIDTYDGSLHYGYLHHPAHEQVHYGRPSLIYVVWDARKCAIAQVVHS